MIALRQIISRILLFVLMLGLAGCATQNVDKYYNEQAIEQEVYPLVITNSNGKEVTIEKAPQRIIAVGPNITETIYALNEQDKLVGRTDYCDYPEEVKQIDSIVGLQEPNIE